MAKSRIFIQEVILRDGLQIEPAFVPTDQKITLADRIGKTGVSKIEVTSFVSPKAVPNLRDAEELLSGINRNPDITYAALVPNMRGAVRAIACKVDEINLVMSVSETHNRANVRRSTEESLNEFAEIIKLLNGSGIKVNGTLATSFGCPFEGIMNEERVRVFAERYLELGMDSITLADTTGMADPAQVEKLASKIRDWAPDIPLTLHFHNTRGMGLANALAGIKCGITRFDASLGGLGGCPFAPGATGNICTEDLVHMLEMMGYDTGVNLDTMLEISRSLPDIVGHDVPGQVAKAGKVTDLHAISDTVR